MESKNWATSVLLVTLVRRDLVWFAGIRATVELPFSPA
jgi:hypothetical protein